jgi:hypothetical protein
MGIFPTTSKLIKKLNMGGNVNVNVDPWRQRRQFFQPQAQFGGFGVEYIPTVPDVPNLQVVENLGRSLVDSQEKLSEKVEKQRPDLNKAGDYINSLPVSAGEKARMWREVNEKYESIDKLMRNNDPYAVFQQEGQQLIKDFGRTLLNPESQSKAAAFKTALDTNRDLSIKSNTFENADILNGRLLVQNKDGSRTRIDKFDYDPEKHSIVVKKDAYSYADSEENVDSDLMINGSQFNFLQSLGEIGAHFDKASGSFLQQGIGKDGKSMVMIANNRAALGAAKRQVMQNLSEQSKDAMYVEYLRQNEGKPVSKVGFDKFVQQQVDNEFSKRLDEKMQSEPLKTTGSGSGSGEGEIIQHTMIPAEAGSTITAKRDDFGTSSNVDIPLVGKSSNPKSDVVFSDKFSGEDVYYFDDTNPFGNKTSTSKNGAFANTITLPEEINLRQKESIVAPVFTKYAQIKITRNNQIEWVDIQSLDDIPAEFRSQYKDRFLKGFFADDKSSGAEGNLVVGGTKEGKIPQKPRVQYGDNGYPYIESNDGMVRYIVSEVGFNVYETMKDGGSGYKTQWQTTGGIVMKRQNLQESVMDFGRDMTGYEENISYLSGSNFTPVGKQFINAILSHPSLDDRTKQAINDETLKIMQLVKDGKHQEAKMLGYQMNNSLNQIKRNLDINNIKGATFQTPIQTAKTPARMGGHVNNQVLSGN